MTTLHSTQFIGGKHSLNFNRALYLRIEMSTKSQEAKDRCEEQNEELKGLKVGLRGEEEMLGGSKEMLCASRSLRGSTSGESQLLQIPEASPCR